MRFSKIVLLAFCLMTLSGCLTNREAYYTYQSDEYDGQLTVQDDYKEEVSIAGIIVAIGAVSALVLGAMAEVAGN